MPKGVYKHGAPANKLGDSDKVPIECRACGAMFLVLPHQSARKYCHHACRGKGRIGYRHSAETIRKIRESNLGLKRSEETKRRVSEAVTRNPLRYWLGKKMPESMVERMSRSHKGIPQPWNRGDKHSNWKGGVTPLILQIRHCFKYVQWRTDVFTRDDFTCVECGTRGGELHADHYPRPFASIFYDNKIASIDQALECEDFWRTDNGRTLCAKCHRQTETWGPNRRERCA